MGLEFLNDKMIGRILLGLIAIMYLLHLLRLDAPSPCKRLYSVDGVFVRNKVISLVPKTDSVRAITAQLFGPSPILVEFEESGRLSGYMQCDFLSRTE